MADPFEKLAFLRMVLPPAEMDAYVAKSGESAKRYDGLEDTPEIKERMFEVWKEAIAIWRSNDAAVDFLFRPHPLLEGRRPVDVIMDDADGAHDVKEILGRLRYGSAA